MPALILGVGGLIPFVGLAALVAFGQDYAYWLAALAYYGAVILSFVGALHWGYAVRRASDAKFVGLQYAFSVLPALVGWSSLLFPVWTGLRIQAAALVICYAFDRAMGQFDPLPYWFARLRALLTIVAVIALGAASYF
jgi:Protein of unknown function (DUF3429)